MARRNDRSDEPKDFLAVKGRFTLSITPQTPRGWLLGAAWVAAIILPYLPFSIWSASLDGTPQEHWIGITVVPMLLLTGLTVWAMIRWTLARADIVSPEEMRDLVRRRPPNKRG